MRFLEDKRKDDRHLAESWREQVDVVVGGRVYQARAASPLIPFRRLLGSTEEPLIVLHRAFIASPRVVGSDRSQLVPRSRLIEALEGQM